MTTQPRTTGPLGLLLIGFFAFITIGFAIGLLNIAWTYMYPEFGVQLADLGVLLFFATAGRLLVAFLSGRLIGGLGLGLVLLLGSVIAGVGLFGIVIVQTWPPLLIAMFVVSLGIGLIDAGLNTFVSANYTTSQLNWLHASFGVGMTFAPAVVTLFVVTAQDSWRWSYLVALIVAVVLMVLFALTLRRWRLASSDDATAPGSSGARVAPLHESLRLPLVWMGIVVVFVYGSAEIGAGRLTNTLFVEGRGIDQETASFWISL
ncbi:MAG: MFS transporter, partial [Chloroflexi bacterium]|nr:MFS transporter [Chloroflexota bacterium]